MRGLAVACWLAATGCAQPSPDGATPPPTASHAADSLRNAGLDLRTLPASLNALTAPQIDAVMQTFVASIGLDCNGCHDPANVATPTRRVRISKRMWSDFVVGRRFADGRPLYCDSCHHGKPTFLARDDTHALGLWMERYFDNGLSRTDQHKNDCFGCHGTPFDPTFLDAWAAGP